MVPLQFKTASSHYKLVAQVPGSAGPPRVVVTAGASCQNFSGSGSGAAIGVGPALRIAPVAGTLFYVAEFGAGWKIVESGMRVAGNPLVGGD